ncbi:MAG: ABC transporter permease [Bacteroidetes bacterium]|nr:ABC transporter permease [Bacteroidota bacterium]
MVKYIGKKIWYGLWVFWGVITLIFFLFKVLPGDPARMMLGQRADISSVEAIQKELGLDRSYWVQYINYLNDISFVSVHKHSNEDSFFYLDHQKYTAQTLITIGDKSVVVKSPYLGRSFQSGRKVSDILAESFPLTLLLAVVAILFAMIIGIFLGVLTSINPDGWVSRTIIGFSAIGVALPSFFAAVLIAWIFAYILGEYTGLNMTGSFKEVDDFGRGEYIQIKNIILPAITLGIRPLAIVVQLTRSSLLNVLSQDYIRTARAKGLSKYRVITRHALKNAMNPVITAISGWFASLLAGAVFVEYVFDWKGLGVVIVDSLEHYDFPVIMGSVLLISVMLVIINIVVDILYGVIDPRVRY